jgi:hypothetical protein
MAAEAPLSKKRTIRDLVEPDDQPLFDKLYGLVDLHGVVDLHDLELQGAIKLAIKDAIDHEYDGGPVRLVDAFMDLELADSENAMWEGHENVDEKCRAILLIDVKLAFGAHREAKRKICVQEEAQ